MKSFAFHPELFEYRIKSYDVNAATAFQKQSEAASVILAYAQKAGFPPADISAEAIEKSIVRRKDDNGAEREIIGYETDRSVTVQVTELKRFPEFVEYLYTLPYVGGVDSSFWSKDAETVLQDLTSEACKSASDKAERLCKGFQKKLGAPYAISENGFDELGRPFGLGDSRSARYGANASLMAGEARDFRVIPATISFSSDVYVIFKVE